MLTTSDRCCCRDREAENSRCRAPATASNEIGRFAFVSFEREKQQERTREKQKVGRNLANWIIRNGGQLTSFRKFQLLGRIRSAIRFTFFSVRANSQIPLRSFVKLVPSSISTERHMARVASEKLKRWRR